MAQVASAWSKPGSWALDSESIEPVESAPASDFPSLAAAAATKVPKKKKPQTISLAEFTNGPAKAAPSPTRLTHDEMLALPTGPRERSAEELERPRGGFSSYGSGSNRNRSDESNPRRSDPRDNGPSRADEADDWGKTKKSLAPENRRSGFYESNANPSRADESDRWTSAKRDIPGPIRSDSRRSGSNIWGFNKERDLDGDNWGKKREENGTSNGTGTGTRPRLVLQPRTLPIVVESNGDHTPQSDQLSETGSSGKKGSGSNPFGLARPREEVLAEKGQDWRKIDEKLESLKFEEKPTFGTKKSNNFGNNASESRTESAWRKTIVEKPRSENGEEAKEGIVEN